jgi:hypothetical protein
MTLSNQLLQDAKKYRNTSVSINMGLLPHLVFCEVSFLIRGNFFVCKIMMVNLYVKPHKGVLAEKMTAAKVICTQSKHLFS